MEIRWSKLLLKAGVWICTEVWLTCLGLDDLADYSEFILQSQNTYQALGHTVCLVM